MKVVRFTSHAKEKFVILARQGCPVKQSRVLEVLERPDLVVDGYKGRRIAQGPLDHNRVLRVVFKESEKEYVVVTFYPGRKSQYEGSIQS